MKGLIKLATKPKSTSKPKPKTPAKPKKSKVTSVSLATEREWQKQDDARILKQAIEIQKDPKRLKAAKEYVDKEMQALKEVSKLKP